MIASPGSYEAGYSFGYTLGVYFGEWFFLFVFLMAVMTLFAQVVYAFKKEWLGRQRLKRLAMMSAVVALIVTIVRFI